MHSWVGFQVRHMTVSSYRGELPDFDVTITRDDAGARLQGTAAVGGIVTRDENLTAHLGAPDFLDASEHPDIRLESSRLERGDGDELRLEGALTMKGISQPVRLRGTISEAMEDPYGKTRLGIELGGAVDRRDFGVNWQAPLPSGGLALGYEVAVSAQVELVRQR